MRSRATHPSLRPTPANQDSCTIPLYGSIAAGTPIEAIRDENGQVDIPPSFLGTGEYYALHVDGDSMIEAGIHDGDTVIIRKTEQAQDGDIVVALVEGEEVTLKRLKRPDPARPSSSSRKTGITPSRPTARTRCKFRGNS